MSYSSKTSIIELFTVVIHTVIYYDSVFVIAQLLALTNTLAFYITELITVVKSFMIKAPGHSGIKFEI
jgi:hypothetical protein